MRFRLHSFGFPSGKVLRTFVASDGHRLLSTYGVLAVVAALLTAHPVIAQCPESTGDISTPAVYRLNQDSSITVSLVEEHLVLSIADSEVSRISVKQQDAGAPKILIRMSSTLFAVLGPVSSYLVPLERAGADVRLGEPQLLPPRYAKPCNFSIWIASQPCIVSPARYSTALSAVVVTGFDQDGQYGTTAFQDNNTPIELKSDQGESLGYLWDDIHGHAVLRSESGIGFTLTKEGISQCGRFPPLLK